MNYMDKLPREVIKELEENLKLDPETGVVPPEISNEKANRTENKLELLENLIVNNDHLIPKCVMIDGEHELHYGSGHMAYRDISVTSNRILGLRSTDSLFKDLILGDEVNFSPTVNPSRILNNQKSTIIGFKHVQEARGQVSLLLAQEKDGNYECQWVDLKDITQESLLKKPNGNNNLPSIVTPTATALPQFVKENQTEQKDAVNQLRDYKVELRD